MHKVDLEELVNSLLITVIIVFFIHSCSSTSPMREKTKQMRIEKGCK